MATLTSTASNTDTATVDHADFWLKDPQDSSLNMTLKVVRNRGLEHGSQEDANDFQPLGRKLPVVVTDVLRGDTLDVTALTVGKAEYDDLVALLGNRRTLLFQTDMEDVQWYVRILSRDIQVRTEYGGRVNNPVRRWRLPMVETEKP